uniref:Uncharacterized protein n=1 Tax=Kalanchoe fedtschenkoi TaxID=63787 RepID=A0A7N0TKL9_KALFE
MYKAVGLLMLIRATSELMYSQMAHEQAQSIFVLLQHQVLEAAVCVTGGEGRGADTLASTMGAAGVAGLIFLMAELSVEMVDMELMMMNCLIVLCHFRLFFFSLLVKRVQHILEPPQHYSHCWKLLIL